MFSILSFERVYLRRHEVLLFERFCKPSITWPKDAISFEVFLWNGLAELLDQLLLCVPRLFCLQSKLVLGFEGFLRVLVIFVRDVRSRLCVFILPVGTGSLLEATPGEEHIQISERVCLGQGAAHLVRFIFTDGLQSR